MFFVMLALKCLAVFVLSAFGFDVIHYILHKWETSRFSFLRKLGALHAVHHDFLDRDMKIVRQHTRLNILNHVIPEYMTSVIGMAVLGFIFGWLPVGLVLALRTVMVIIYVIQKGEDITHRELGRIDGNRSSIFVGPHYHALHHIHVNQHYSSFFSTFDIIFGTNCQIRGRRFFVNGGASDFGRAMSEELRARGGIVETLASSNEELKEQLAQTDVLVIAESDNDDDFGGGKISDVFLEIGRNRLLPPEVWALRSEMDSQRARSYSRSSDVTYRQMRKGFSSSAMAAKLNLFFISRGLL